MMLIASLSFSRLRADRACPHASAFLCWDLLRVECGYCGPPALNGGNSQASPSSCTVQHLCRRRRTLAAAIFVFHQCSLGGKTGLPLWIATPAVRTLQVVLLLFSANGLLVMIIAVGEAVGWRRAREDKQSITPEIETCGCERDGVLGFIVVDGPIPG